jgi:hypothetical protein
MKFTVMALTVLVGGLLVMGTMVATPARAADECSAKGDLIKCIDSDLKGLDKELSKIFKG